MHYALSCRTERPIAGCELAPHPFLFLKGGTLDNATRAKLMDQNQHKFTFRWFRGPRRQLCQSEQCPRGSTYDPVSWSKAAVGGSSLKCAICEKSGVAGHLSLFCSASCFKSAWKGHCGAHHTSLKPTFRKRNVSKGTFMDEELEIEAATIPSESTGGSSCSSLDTEDNWVACAEDKAYIPVGEDVGCVLKVEVCAIAMNDGKVLAGPITTYTDPVLAAPRGPPKRHLVTTPAPSSTVTTGARFRVISYNILAELYATKQAYPYCDSWSLAWPYRKAMIEQEVEEAQGDIVCLQVCSTQ